MSADRFRTLLAHPVRTVARAPMRKTAQPAHPTVRNPRAVLRTVMAFVALSAGSAFAIQAWFAYGFARFVWTLPFALACAVPVANDLYIVTLMFVSYLLRTAPMRTRAYIWCSLSVGIGAQIGAAYSFEHWRATGEKVGVAYAALVPAVLLAAALHSLIIAARHLGAPDGQGRDEQAEADEALRAADADFTRATSAEQAAGRAPVTAPPPRPATAPAVPPVSSGRRPTVKPTDDDAVAEVRGLVAAGVSCRDAAKKLRRSVRWAEQHTKDIRATLRDIPPIEFHDGETDREGASFPKDEAAPAGEMHPPVADQTGTATDLETA